MIAKLASRYLHTRGAKDVGVLYGNERTREKARSINVPVKLLIVRCDPFTTLVHMLLSATVYVARVAKLTDGILGHPFFAHVFVDMTYLSNETLVVSLLCRALVLVITASSSPPIVSTCTSTISGHFCLASAVRSPRLTPNFLAS